MSLFFEIALALVAISGNVHVWTPCTYLVGEKEPNVQHELYIVAVLYQAIQLTAKNRYSTGVYYLDHSKHFSGSSADVVIFGAVFCLLQVRIEWAKNDYTQIN